MTSPLPVSLLVSLSVSLTAAAAQAQAQNTALFLGQSTVIDPVQRYRSYPNLTAVGQDFASNTPEYQGAQLWFSQSPQPQSLLIGRWVQSASHGQLLCGTLPSNILAVLEAITNGGFSVTVDGGSAQHITGLNFSGISNLNGAATIISAALTGATCSYSATQNEFQFTSSTTGTSSTVSFLSAPSSGTDISSTINGTNTAGNGAYLSPGLAAETALSAVQAMDASFGSKWYGLAVLGAADADHEAIAAYVEAPGGALHIYAATTQEAGVLSTTSTTDIAYILNSLGYTRTILQYSSSNPYAACSLLGRALTVDYTQSNSVIDLMYKNEPGITAETIGDSQLQALLAKNCNAFLAYQSGTISNIIQPGNTVSGVPIDERTSADWLGLQLQISAFNNRLTTTTKIPQTDAGSHIDVTTFEEDCQQAVTNGMLAPGVWTGPSFGALQTGQWMPTGYYVYAPPIATQKQTDRSARKSVPYQVGAKLAGSSRTVSISLTINQ